MRLIDADIENEKLIDFITQHDVGILFALEHKDMTMLEDIFFEYFSEQETAYNLENIIKQLEENTEAARMRYSACDAEKLKCMNFRYAAQYRESEKCLNIVKAGFGKRTADENMEKSIKAFSIPHEAWYKDIVLEGPHIYAGMYYESGGTDGEFRIVWDNIGIQLRAYNDSWEALSRMPELIGLMAKIDREKLNPTVTEFAEMLEKIGFKDITERERVADKT